MGARAVPCAGLRIRTGGPKRRVEPNRLRSHPWNRTAGSCVCQGDLSVAFSAAECGASHRITVSVHDSLAENNVRGRIEPSP